MKRIYRWLAAAVIFGVAIYVIVNIIPPRSPAPDFYSVTGFNPYYTNSYEVGNIVSSASGALSIEMSKHNLQSSTSLTDMFDETINEVNPIDKTINSNYAFGFVGSFNALVGNGHLASSLNSDFSLRLKITRGRKISLKKIPSKSQLLSSLDYDALRQLERKVDNGKTLLFIKEVLIADDGYLSYAFENELSDSVLMELDTLNTLLAKDSMASIKDLNVKIHGRDNNELMFSYDGNPIGYICDTIKLDDIRYAISKNVISKVYTLPADFTYNSGARVLPLNLSASDLKPSKNYKITIHVDLYKNHQYVCNCVSQQQCYTYVAVFRLFDGDKQIPNIRGQGVDDYRLNIIGNNPITNASIDIIVSNIKPDLNNGFNLNLFICDDNDKYYSQCEGNHTEPLVFRKGSYIKIEEQ